MKTKKQFTVMFNSTAAQTIAVSNILLSAKAQEVKNLTVGKVFTSDSFATDWSNIYVHPNLLQNMEVNPGMRKLTAPTLVITSHSNKMAFILASEKLPVFIPNTYYRDSNGYLLAINLAPVVTPEYMYYMCKYDQWSRFIAHSTEEDSYGCGLDWKSVGISGDADPVTGKMFEYKPLDYIRQVGKDWSVPSIQDQEATVEAAKKQESKIESLSRQKFDFTTVFSNFLLNAQKENIIINQTYGLLVECYKRKLGAKANKKVLEILQPFENDFDKSLLASEELDFLSENLGQLFDFVVNPSTFSHNEDGTFLQPKEVTEYICQLLNISPDETVYNPFAGTASYAVSLPNPVNGEEKDKVTWALAQIRLAGNKVNPATEIKLGDSFESITDGKKYRAIITSPSYFKQKGQEIFDIVEHLYDKLENGGQMACIVTSSFLAATSGGAQRVKERLIAEKAIIAVITLPENIFANTSISQSIVVLTKGGNNEQILFSDASYFTRFSKSSLRPTTFDYHSFQSKFEESIYYHAENGKDEEDAVVTCVKYPDIVGTRLSPAYYLTSRPTNGVRLSTLVEITETSLTKESGLRFPVVFGKDLSATYLNCDIDWQSFSTDYTGFIKVLVENSLVMVFLNGLCKVGKLSEVSTEHPVALHPTLIAFNIKSNSITEDFLLRSIMSDGFIRQAKSLQSRFGLTPESFLEIEIEVPSIEEQNRLCKEDTRKSLSEADRLLIESHEEFRKDMHMKKHAIGQTIFNLNNWWNILSRARREGNGILDESGTVGNAHKVLIRDIFDNLRQSIDQLQQQISKFDRGNGLVPEEFALTEFIEQYISTHKSPMFEFQYDSTKHRATKSLPMIEFDEDDNPIAISDENVLSEGDPLEYVTFPREALTIIFDNIISNACAHGFTNPESSAGDNLIRIDIISEGLNYIVEISNNGAPLDKNISTEDVFTYGKSTSIGKSHFGIGGYEVFRLMKEFNSDAELISDPTEDFPVKYRLIFKDTNIIATFG
ncbi:MAG: N-6 DNA methylase [Muribaculum sp.]|nr:N-6 DNA methylase [Muribaculum sp.]